MRGYETVEHYESLSERIQELPWEEKKARIVYELMKDGLDLHLIIGSMEGVMSYAEVCSTVTRLRIALRRGDHNGLVRKRGLRRAEEAVVRRPGHSLSQNGRWPYQF